MLILYEVVPHECLAVNPIHLPAERQQRHFLEDSLAATPIGLISKNPVSRSGNFETWLRHNLEASASRIPISPDWCAAFRATIRRLPEVISTFLASSGCDVASAA